jgi:hypothetical protein
VQLGALAGWLLLVLLPGLVLATACLPRAPLLDRVAVAGPVSLGVVACTAAWVSVAGLPVGTATVTAPLLVLSGAGAALLVVRRRGPGRSLRHRVGPGHLVLLGAIALGVLMWWLVLGSLDVAIAGDDGYRHGIFVARVMIEHTVDPSRVAVADTSSGGAGVAYYPLALHTIAALVGDVVPASVPVLLSAGLVAAGMVWAGVGTYALTRRLVAHRWAPAAAALLACVALPWVPFGQSYWGGWPTVLGLALLPGTALLLLALGDATAGRASAVAGVPAALGVAGLLHAHPSELLGAGLGAGAVVLVGGAGVAVGRGRWAARAAAVGVGALLLSWPWTRLLRDGAAERSVDLNVDHPPADVPGLLWHTVVLGGGDVDDSSRVLWLWGVGGAVALLLVTGVGAVVWWRRGQARGWLMAAAAMLLVVVLAATRTGLGLALSFPWFGNWVRASTELLPFAAPVGGLGAAVVGGALVRRLARADVRRPVAVGAVAAAGVVLLVLPQAARAVSFASAGYLANSVLEDSDRAAIGWLAGRGAAAGERVMNDPRDGSAWMYALSAGALDPVLVVDPRAPAPAFGDDRLWLAGHVQDAGRDARVDAAVSALGIRYVMVGARPRSPGDRLLDVVAIAASPGLRVAMRVGGTLVYEVVRR